MTASAPVRTGGRVAVIGAINLDLVVTADRLPSPGETVVGDAVARHGGGKGANAAVAAARSGARVRFIGAVGQDAEADVVTADLSDASVDLSGLARLAQAPTGAALIVVDPSGENQIAVGAGANAALDAGWVRRQVGEAVDHVDALLVSTEIPNDAIVAAIEAGAKAGLTCVLNPAPPVEAVRHTLDHQPLLTPNRGELAILVQRLGIKAADDVHSQASRLSAATGCALAVTLGAGGVLVVDNGQVDAIAAWPVTVVDATGAGDTFNGVLVGQLAAGAGLADAARVAVVAASLATTGAGARTGMPDADVIGRQLI